MAKPSAVIIGAGLAGLSAGCYAQMQGFQTTIFEHAINPGGVAAYWSRKGYKIDGGIHFMSGHKPGVRTYELYKELGVAQPELFTDMKSYGRYINEAENVSLTIGPDLSTFAKDAKASAPHDHGIVDEIVNAAIRFRGLDLYGEGMENPPELRSWCSSLRDMWRLRSVWKFMGKGYSQSVQHFTRRIKAAWLQDCINGLFQPEVPMWFVFMLLAEMADGKMAYLTKGCESFVRALETRYKALGGEVKYMSTVSRILAKDNRAYGVKLANNEEHFADNVISAGDGYNTLFNLLNNEYTTPRIAQRYKEWPICRPFLIASFGVRGEFPAEIPFTTLTLKQPLKVGSMLVPTIFLRILNYGPGFAPSCSTLVQAEFESDWEFWYQLREQNILAYRQEKQRVGQELLQCMERLYPGISRSIQMRDVATPATTYRFTLNRNGSWGGWLLNPTLLNAKIERVLPNLRNFYMAGHWVSGGGVISSLYSGKHAVKLMVHKSHT